MTRSSALVRVATIALLGAIPGAALHGVVAGPSPILVGLGVAAIAALVGTVSATKLERPLQLVAIAAAGAIGVAVAVAGLSPVERVGDGLVGATADALTNGWSELLTSPIPADPSARTLVPLAVTVWSATVAAGMLTARRPGRRPTVQPLLPLGAAIVGASIVAGREQYRPVLLGLLCAVLAAAFIATFRPRANAEARVAGGRPGARAATTLRRGPAPLVALLVAATTAGALVGPTLVFGRDAFDPRDRIDPPTLPAGATNPLELFASRQRTASSPMFVVESDEPLLTRLVALDRFDGARWTSSVGYEPSGTVIEPAERTGVTRRQVAASVQVDGLTGPWLPIAGDTTRLTGVPFRIDPESGSVLATHGDADGSSYRFEALVTDVDLAVLQTLPAAADAHAAAARTLPPGMPALLTEMANVATTGATTPFVQAVTLERYFRLNFDRDEQLLAGHSYGHLNRALTEIGAGTDEQFASAFAVLGRSVGLPTRVVVGFGPGEQQPDGTFVVRSGDTRVWPEVKFDGAGWIPFDPTPQRDDDTTPIVIGPGGGAGFVVTEAEDLDALTVDRPPPVVVRPDPGTDWARLGMWATIAVGTLVALSAAAIVIVKRRRTAWRRREGDGTTRVVGAWTDVLERFAEMDGDDPQHRTVEQLVDETEATTASLTGLYRPVLRALYDGSPCSDADADQAWRARDRFVRAARRDASPVRRLGWSLDPRPMATEMRRVRQDRTMSRVAEPAAAGAAGSST